MNNYVSIILSSLLSACIAIVLFAFLFPRETVIIEKQMPGQLVGYEKFLNKKAQELLNNPTPPTSFVEAAGKTRESVVYIRTLTESGTQTIFEENLNAASGSGVIISPDGFIATNHHVVADAVRIEVTLNDNREFTAEVVGLDPSTDLALIKIESDNLPFVLFGNSDQLQVGEWVLAVGNPFRLQSTVTAGIVSAKARNINILEGRQGIESFIQTDAAVNPGNSGGALVNVNGELVGINAAIISKSGGYEGFSFAIPANLARKVIYDLKEYGVVQRGWIGIEIHNLTAEESDKLGLDFVQGVYIDRVTKGSAAQQANLRSSDVLVAVNNTKTLNVPAFMEQIGRFRPGDVINISYYRNKVKKSVKVTLRNQINTTDFIAVRKDPILTELGIELRDLGLEEQKSLDTQGVYVVSVTKSSTIGNTKMAPGFIINKINNKKIQNVNEVVQLLKSKKGTIVMEGMYESYPGIYPYTFINE